jgi:hypothetical protein
LLNSSIGAVDPPQERAASGVGTAVMNRVSLCQDLWIFRNKSRVLWREVRIHELGPAELAVVVFPLVAPSLVLLSDQGCALEVVLLAPKPPVLLVSHETGLCEWWAARCYRALCGLAEIKTYGGQYPPLREPLRGDPQGENRPLAAASGARDDREAHCHCGRAGSGSR